MTTPLVIPLGDLTPRVDRTAWVAPGATLVGDVHVASQASVWFGAVLRGDGDTIRVGARSNLQDGCVGHTDPGFPLTVGEGVSVGHRAVLHGCTVEDGALVGNGSIVLHGAVISSGAVVGSGAVVTNGTVVPPGALAIGIPARIKEGAADPDLISYAAESYVRRAHRYPLELRRLV